MLPCEISIRDLQSSTEANKCHFDMVSQTKQSHDTLMYCALPVMFSSCLLAVF